MTDKKEHKPYESAVTELEVILTQLESNELPLEEAIKKFESGMELIKHCQGILDTTEQKIKTLTNEYTQESESNEGSTSGDIPFS